MNITESTNMWPYTEEENEYLKQYLNKPLLLDGMNAELAFQSLPNGLSKKHRKKVALCFQPFIKEVNEDTNIKISKLCTNLI